MTTAIYCSAAVEGTAIANQESLNRGVARFWDSIKAEPNPALSALRLEARQILEDSGMERFNSFWKQSAGWYPGGEGECLSHNAVRYFNRFSALIGGLLPSPVNLFMGLEGSLEITWRNADGKLFDIEFFDDRIGYFFEVTGQEGEINPSGLCELAQRVRTLLS